MENQPQTLMICEFCKEEIPQVSEGVDNYHCYIFFNKKEGAYETRYYCKRMHLIMGTADIPPEESAEEKPSSPEPDEDLKGAPEFVRKCRDCHHKTRRSEWQDPAGRLWIFFRPRCAHGKWQRLEGTDDFYWKEKK